MFDPADGSDEEKDLLAKIEGGMMGTELAAPGTLPRARFKPSADVEHAERSDEEESEGQSLRRV